MRAPATLYASVAFKRRGGRYRGSTPLSDLALLSNDPAQTLQAATDVYQTTLKRIQRWRRRAAALNRSRVPLSARQAWELGDIVHGLTATLADHGCQIENLYDHLKRHAGLSPKWLSPFVTLRRYVDTIDAIPTDLKWRNIAKGPKAAAQALVATRSWENRT